MPIIDKELKKRNYSSDQIDLLKRKGVFPYDHIKSFQSLEERQLPSKEDFYSSLNDSNISSADYDHAKNVWSSFSCQSLGDYSDIYLQTDCFLLATIFEAYRAAVMLHYGLEVLHYITSPGQFLYS